ncbi:transposable element P transposase [Paramisgurnus dabryanus]|uniref:transposable element P transposase n=1 Tax=Paramisgurnus dabryanus TaxID=90735 RepID=UPI003CCEFAF3
MEEKFAHFFSKDQIKAICKKSKRGIRWEKNTVKKALQVRFATGSTGYKALQDMGIPLPDIRTLQRKVQFIKMEPGILEEVFDMLKLKAGGLTEMEKECVLTLDEMAITPSIELHLGTGKLYGDVTLPGHTGVATHACVFMLAGSTTRWKQVVAYHYSGNSTNGAVYKSIIVNIIEKAASIGLHVVNVTTDMGSPNRAMWKAFGVNHNNTFVSHPTRPDRKLYFMPDVPHLVKNLKSALVRGQTFTLPPDIVEKENLSSNEVAICPLKDLVDFQEGMALKIAPNMSSKILKPTHFDKMKVGPAMHVFSKATSAALRYMVEQEQRPTTYQTTAWFLEQVDHWFDIMSSRHPVMALSRHKLEEYQKAIKFLQDMMQLFRGLKIGQTGSWKPVQTGIVMATSTILSIQQDMLAQGHMFVLTSRFTQDCLENLFSCIRQRNPVPTPVQFHQALKSISVGQFLTTVKTGSYQEDDSILLADFLDPNAGDSSPGMRLEELMEHGDAPELTKTETCALYHLTGYIVHKVIKHSNICNDCQSAIKHNGNSPEGEHSILLKLKEFKPGVLCRPSQDAFDVVHQLEMMFRAKTSASIMALPNAIDLLEKEASHLDSKLPSCHDLQKKISNRYIRLRLRIAAKDIWAKRKKVLSGDGHLGSKSQTKRAKMSQQNHQTSRATTSRPLPNIMIVAMQELGLTFAPIEVQPPAMASYSLASPLSPTDLQQYPFSTKES